ncbi:hypothetical protein NESM_000070400 [Novymonas esmeraldas]|uniref:Uncharacterized protein n=1 Tax=Novymonas esmeraldas TaxID=1808958 RepID=A0AAW0F4W5_9TRYP
MAHSLLHAGSLEPNGVPCGGAAEAVSMPLPTPYAAAAALGCPAAPPQDMTGSLPLHPVSAIHRPPALIAAGALRDDTALASCSSPPAPTWGGAAARVDCGVAADGGAEEDEAVRGDDALGERLHLHPTTAIAIATGAPRCVASSLDPVTAALARQQQQQFRGEPRSPLSPRTLQALYAASAEGRHSAFLAQLTADDVLAAPPLALTWYPSVPAGVTKHADRKRAVDGTSVAAMHEHEESMLAEEEGVAQDAVGPPVASAAPPLRRQRLEEAVAPLPLPLPPSAAPALVAAHAPPPVVGDGAQGDSAAAACASPDAARMAPSVPRKRDRDERVFEFLTRGRRLR